jgi:signal peptidase II
MQKNSDAGSLKTNQSYLWLLPVATAVVLIDEVTKWWALGHLPDESAADTSGIMTFAIHRNMGIAFDIPFRMPLIIVISILIGLALLWVSYRNFRLRPVISISALMIVIGALGNLYDRMAYGFTVDYIILFSRSAINVSDIVIVVGVVALLQTSRVRAATLTNVSD